MRFLLCLGIGLFGLTIILKTLIDVLFLEWDVVADISHYAKEISRRRHYVMLSADDSGEPRQMSWQQSRYHFAHRELPQPVAMPDS
ncbi:MAG: hypothetical protein HY922_05190 [Elusimicrobia bacterium]|nr:hypothetical protein [Elusimicrobiota bacterium]